MTNVHHLERGDHEQCRGIDSTDREWDTKGGSWMSIWPGESASVVLFRRTANAGVKICVTAIETTSRELEA